METGPPLRRNRHRGLAGATLAIGLVGVVLAVIAHHVAYFPIDLTITREVQSVHGGWFELPLRALSTLGFPPVAPAVYGAVILLIFIAGWSWEAVATTVSVLAGTGVNHLVKTLVARPRPPEGLIHVAHQIHNSSFPAGHVLNFTAFAGFLCYLAWAKLAPSWRRTLLVAVLIALIGLMGLARIDDGEHWLSDVLGGYCFGFLCLAAGVAFYAWAERKGWIKGFESGKPHRIDEATSGSS